MKFYDFLCLIPLYLGIRGVIGHRYRNLWILFSAQSTIILYLFMSELFDINANLLSFSFLLTPITIDSYKGVALWKSEGFFERVDGFAHLITASMLVYQHPFHNEDTRHLWFALASSLLGFLLGFTARIPQKKPDAR